MDLITVFLFGCLGTVSVELLKLYELRGKLLLKKYAKLLKNSGYWLITGGFCIVCSLLVVAFYYGSDDPEAFQVVLTGMGMSSIIRRFIEATNANSEIDFGDSDGWRDMYS